MNNKTIGSLNVRGAIVAGLFGGVLYGLNFGFQALVGIFGLTGATGFVTGFTVPFFLALASQINRQWGTATVIWTLYSLLAIPTALMGVPGVYKIFVGVLGGLAYDLGYCGLKGRRVGLYVALILYVAVLNVGFYTVYALGIVPEVSGGSVIKVLLMVSVVFLAEGAISTYLSELFYLKRVKRLVQ